MTDGNPVSDHLIVEYEQASETYRNQAQLLHRSYYLSAIVFTFLVGAIVNLFSQESFVLAALVSALGSGAFVLLGMGAYAYHQRRERASNYRFDLMDRLNDLTDEEAVFELQHKMSGQDVGKGFFEFYLGGIYRLLWAAALIFLGTAFILSLLAT